MTKHNNQNDLREYLNEHGLYRIEDEHDACGVGFVASIHGEERRDIVDMGIAALKSVWHRGAVDADGKTGDGAGLHIQLPTEFFRDYVKISGGDAKDYMLAVGQVFLPHTNFAAQEAARTIVESEILRFGYTIHGWRQVPVNISVLGDKAKSNMPEIEQIIIANSKQVSAVDFERELYIIRRRIEKEINKQNINNFYICTLSHRSIIYKGMCLAENLAEFYPDLYDGRFKSRFVIFHQRYSTNTFPEWRLAQPFRTLAHNGEINTLKGNVNWMKSHEIRMASSYYGEYANDIKPIIQPNGSDSAALDAVFEVMIQSGRSAPWVKTMLVPEAWEKLENMPKNHKAMYAYAQSVMEPWDGPAALVITDGNWILAGMDRNGLRPLRYLVTDNGLVVAGSESGMIPIKETSIIEKGRLGPGKMLAINFNEQKFYRDKDLKDKIASQVNFSEWVESITPLENGFFAQEKRTYSNQDLIQRQITAGFSVEDIEAVLHPMAKDGKEALGSMGDDTPLAVLSEYYRPLSHYFRQSFSQVTNPPIDPLRESHVMSLKTRFGNLRNVLEESRDQVEIFTLESPIVINSMYHHMMQIMGSTVIIIDCTFSKNETLKDALSRIQQQAKESVLSGTQHLLLTDEFISNDKCAIPMILATGAIHSHLVKEGLRTYTSINVRAAECIDSHYVAVLIGVGATTINPYIAIETLIQRHEKGLLNTTLEQAIDNFKYALDNGLLKILSKSGISVLSSYRGGYNFEIIGLSRALVSEFFPSMQSRISGIGLKGLAQKAINQHDKAFFDENILPIGGFYKQRAKGEKHAHEGSLIHLLQHAVNENSYQTFKKYSQRIWEDSQKSPITIRDLLDFKPSKNAISADQVESVTEIRKRFITPGMSLGSLSPEAHKTLSIAMNRIGARSNSGEGGEDPAHYTPNENGDNANTAIKQIASGRFGVTAEYLNQCREIEIKVAQGAKPGEGGQLPGFKVTELIARLRHSTKGVMLISPPPHHDIYSIEDLAQLIYDLKQINPVARVCVKLVSQAGIGTVAAGVAKAKADVIAISGHSGGTGASPLTSIKFAGAPWELGLAEANQVLTLNKMRHQVRLRTDGGLRTGRDIVIAAMLGAEEYGIGTAALIAMGCIMVRQCQSNTCPVGVCTQNEKLREKFTGTAEKVVNLFSLIAEEVREILASLGLRSLQEAIGRTDLLLQTHRGSDYLDDLDLNPLLIRVEADSTEPYCTLASNERNHVPDTLDKQIIEDAKPLFDRREKMELAYNISNTHRAIGTRTASKITTIFGMQNLPDNHLIIRLKGSAGQSLGAFTVKGMKIEVLGDANDYVGKGLSGATIIVRPAIESTLISKNNAIIGNTVLYGATAGNLFASGLSGERFAVRNSGANAVIEGSGSNACEYMTGGMVVILGDVGSNFGAGMTGGMAFIYDEHENFMQNVNDETILINRIESSYWEEKLLILLQAHIQETKSSHASYILSNWQKSRQKFWQICPKDMLDKLEAPLKEGAFITLDNIQHG